jgi:uncharacterized SAM-binding protein YcdF (DUF218 family)
MRRRLTRFRLLLVGLVALPALAVVMAWLLVRSPAGRPGAVDAVLVLAGGRGERMAAGAQLALEGVAPVLVLSDGGRPGPMAEQRCRQRVEGVRVVCLTPDISTTQGEARAFAGLAAREGWRSVAVVTSSYHVRRAGLLVRRCFPGTVRTFGATPVGINGLQVVLFSAREAVAMAAALTLQRGC